MQLNYLAGNIHCFGGSTTIAVTAYGGTQPYIGTGIYNVSAGTHNFTIFDDGGCSINTGDILFSEPAQLVANVEIIQPILCFGNKATVAVSATGGTAPYSGIGNFDVNAGTYLFTITDAKGCVAISEITVNSPAQLIATSAITSQIKCYGLSATIQVSATGGTTPYQGVGTFSEFAGSYTYFVADNNGCISNTTPLLITEPTELQSNIEIIKPINCFGEEAIISVSAVGGTSPYSGIGNYAVTAGNYNYYVTDENACVSASNTLISQPSQLTATSFILQQIECAGENATILVTAAGGIQPYTGVGNIESSAGLNTFVVKDANNCPATTTQNIDEPLPIEVEITQTNPIICNGDVSAALHVLANGGAGGFSYIWNNNRLGENLNNIPAGNYSVVVTDILGCTTAANFSIVEPNELEINVLKDDISCYDGNDGKIQILPIGGQTPYSYTFYNGNTQSHSSIQSNDI